MNHLKKLSFLVMSISLLAACSSPMQRAEEAARLAQLATPIEEKMEMPFDEAMARAAFANGKASIKGVLFHQVTTRGKIASDPDWTASPPQFLSNVQVVLYPATPYFREWRRLEAENAKGVKTGKVQAKTYMPNERMFIYSRSTKTDENGRYYFSNLNPGTYYILAADQNISSRQTLAVRSGSSVLRDGYYSANVDHFRNEEFNMITPVKYDDYVEIPANQKELIVESRMRRK